MNSIKSFFKYSLFIWPFIYSNARLFSQEGGSEIYSIFRFIGPEFRMIEASILIGINIFIFLYMFFLRKKDDYMTFSIFLLFVLVSIVSILSIAEGIAPTQYIFRSSYELLCPFLVFNIGSKMNINEKMISQGLKFLFVIMIINTIAIFHQFIFLYNGIFVDGDLFRGIFADAHIQAIFSYSAALFIMSTPSILKKFYLFLPLNIFCAFVSSNEKAAIFFSIVVFGLILRSLNIRNAIFVLGILLISLLNIVPLIELFSPRLLEYSDIFTFQDLVYFSGPFQMGFDLIQQFSGSIKNIMFGIGPSLFGGPSCLALIQNNLAPYYIADIFIVEALGTYNILPLSGFFSKSSFYITIIGEFGIIVFFVFIILVKYIFSLLLKSNRLFFKKSLISVFIFIFLCATLSSYSVWDSQTILTPLFLFISYIYNNQQSGDKIEFKSS